MAIPGENHLLPPAGSALQLAHRELVSVLTNCVAGIPADLCTPLDATASFCRGLSVSHGPLGVQHRCAPCSPAMGSRSAQAVRCHRHRAAGRRTGVLPEPSTGRKRPGGNSWIPGLSSRGSPVSA